MVEEKKKRGRKAGVRYPQGYKKREKTQSEESADNEVKVQEQAIEDAVNLVQ